MRRVSYAEYIEKNQNRPFFHGGQLYYSIAELDADTEELPHTVIGAVSLHISLDLRELIEDSLGSEKDQLLDLSENLWEQLDGLQRGMDRWLKYAAIYKWEQNRNIEVLLPGYEKGAK